MTKTVFATKGHLRESEPFTRISEERAFQDKETVHVKACRQEQDGMFKIQQRG